MIRKILLLLFVTLSLVLQGCGKSKGGGDEPSASQYFGCQLKHSVSDQSEIQTRYTLFESGHVRPMTLSPDGSMLFVVNTPNNCLEVYKANDKLTPVASIPVGLEPVAVAAPSNEEVWVVNQLSDSVSVVDLQGTPKVKTTLLVGDEPRDIVFAGANNQRAFITSAYRGQNHPSFKSSHLQENGHGRADVWVFDRTALGANLGGTPLTIINLFTDTPRALAVSNDGATVYAAAFNSGNQTTVIEQGLIESGTEEILLGYYANNAGGDLTVEQMTEITGITPESLGVDVDTAIQMGIEFGILFRIDGNVVAPYRNSSIYRINSSGQLINQISHAVTAVDLPSGVRLVAAADVPAFTGVRAKPQPSANNEGLEAPSTGLIVKYDGTEWRDSAGTNWSNRINFSLPDYDVFAIDASAAVPEEKSKIAHVGTTLFNMAVNPKTGKLYVSNLESGNEIRFEGPGSNASTVRGNITQSRISVIDNTTVLSRNLNKHLKHTEAQGQAIAASEKAKTLSQPLQMTVTSDGNTLYVAAFGSNKIGIFQTQALEDDSFSPAAEDHIALPEQGPTGVVLNKNATRLFVTTRYDNSVHVINTKTKEVLASQAMFTPEPQSVIEGRRFLYDADLTSANGENACSSCHIFGDMDAISWDLGNPDASTTPQPINVEPTPLSPSGSPFHPMKGPMSTQTLRGIADHGPMHWRGDRTGDNPATVNGKTESREAAAFKAFNPAFVGLVGREQELSKAQMQQFTDFALQITPPPNPVRSLDNALTASQQKGHDVYMNQTTDSVATCNGCHEVDAEKKRFGSNTTVTFEGGRVSQDFKVPQLRNLYAKVGRFDDGKEQIRGYGFLHDGSEPTLLRFLHSGVFNFGTETDRTDVIEYLFAIDSNLAPVVGQQITVTSDNLNAALVRVDMMLQRSQQKECDVVATGVVNGKLMQAVAQDAAQFSMANSEKVDRSTLLENLPITFTCYPPGNAQRLL